MFPYWSTDVLEFCKLLIHFTAFQLSDLKNITVCLFDLMPPLSLQPCTPSREFIPPWHQQAQTAGEWPIMQFSLAFSVGGIHFFSSFSLPPTPPICTRPLSASKPPNYTQAGLVYTHSLQANADTWQIKGLINSLCRTISPPPPKDENKQICRSARPACLVGLSVDDWVAQGCLVWGLGWSHNCFLWVAQPPRTSPQLA